MGLWIKCGNGLSLVECIQVDLAGKKINGQAKNSTQGFGTELGKFETKEEAERVFRTLCDYLKDSRDSTLYFEMPKGAY